MKIPTINAELKRVDISEVTPYEKNPRKNDDAVDDIATSLKEFGQIRPIGVDENNEILYGHTVYKACQKLKLDSILILIHAGLDPTHKKAYRIADNKLAERSYWNYGLLESEVKEIIEEMNIDFLFSEEEMNSLFNFDIVENENLASSKADDHLYAGTAIALQIHDIVCFIDDDNVNAFVLQLSAKLLEQFGSDQKKYNKFGTDLLNLVKENENLLLQ